MIKNPRPRPQQGRRGPAAAKPSRQVGFPAPIAAAPVVASRNLPLKTPVAGSKPPPPPPQRSNATPTIGDEPKDETPTGAHTGHLPPPALPLNGRRAAKTPRHRIIGGPTIITRVSLGNRCRTWHRLVNPRSKKPRLRRPVATLVDRCTGPPGQKFARTPMPNQLSLKAAKSWQASQRFVTQATA